MRLVRVSLCQKPRRQVLSRRGPYPVKKQLCLFTVYIYGPSQRENLSSGIWKNKGEDQPAHMCSLFSAFVIHLLKSIISRFTMNENLNFRLVSIADQAGLNLTLSEPRRQVFLRRGPNKARTTSLPCVDRAILQLERLTMFAMSMYLHICTRCSGLRRLSTCKCTAYLQHNHCVLGTIGISI